MMKDESKDNEETNKGLRSARLSPDDLKDGLRILVLQVRIDLFVNSDNKFILSIKLLIIFNYFYNFLSK